MGERMRYRPGWWSAAAKATAMLPVVRLLLWTRGYRRTMQLLAASLPARTGAAERADDVPPRIAEIASAVTTVARLVPFRSRCLARSITIWWLCGRCRYEVDVLIGVAPPEGNRLPAHAWAEYRGLPLNDTPDVRSRYGVISP
jgi:hypothetical protein